MPYLFIFLSDKISIKKGVFLTFNRYLKLCRTNLKLTQAELVSELYNFDTVFEKLDVNTIGRWERAVTHTPLAKQVKILHYFFQKLDFYFPFLDMNSIEKIEEKFSTESVHKFLGKHKKIVMSFPTSHSEEDDFKVLHARESKYKETAFATAINICDDMYGSGRFYSLEKLESFSNHPSTLFLLCEYKEQYFGHAFFIYIKQDIYNKVMSFEMDYMDITSEHLASKDEPASYFSTGLFAMNEKAIALLFVRLYAHLIIEQKKILEIGTLISDGDAVNIAKNFGLQKIITIEDLMAYNATIKEVLLTEQIVKMMFTHF